MSGRPPRGFARRSAHVVGTGSRQAARHAVARRDPAARADSHREAARAAAGLLGTLKGGAMKLGQLASFVELDFIPEAYRELWQSELAVLRDAAPPVDFLTVAAVLERAWDAPADRVLDRIDPVPAASASIGQVHRGRTRDGLEVAVKVQYPDIARAVRTDVGTAAALLRLVRPYAPNVDLKALAAELRERIVEELDYEQEADHQRAFRRAYRDHPFIRVPEVVTELCRPEVIVTEWVDGLGFEAVRALGAEARDRYGEILVRFFFGSLETVGLCHADPHPGNHRLCPDGRVAFLDYGAVRRMDPARLAIGNRLGPAAVAGDARAVAEAMAGLGWLHDPAAVDRDQLLAAVRTNMGYLMEDRPTRIDPDFVRGQLEALTAASDRFELRRERIPPEDLWYLRMQLSLVAVLAQLRATANWQRIAMEGWVGAPPATPLGEAGAAWRARF